jgi:hypothetical protein
MRMKSTGLLMLLAASMPLAGLSSAHAEDNNRCSGHELLPTPRAESSCAEVRPEIYPSPDKGLRALVLPVEADLHATPDMESRVVIRSADGKLLTSKDYSSPRGANGYYVAHARWSPDSQFFVFSTASSGGHSPWSFPTWVFSREKNVIVSFNKMIGDNPTTSEEFKFSGPHTVTATTWEKPGSDNRIPVAVDLEEAMKKIAASEK